MQFLFDKEQFSHYLTPRREFFSVIENERQGSSGVEQRTHKPFVGSSILPPATIFNLSSHPFVDREDFFCSALKLGGKDNSQSLRL